VGAGPAGGDGYEGSVTQPTGIVPGPARGRPRAVRLVALDLDGTVLDLDERLTDRVRSAVAAVAESGIEVVVATGRSVLATLPVLDRLGLLRGWAVCSNGALTVRLDPATEQGYEVVTASTFDPGPALRLLHQHLPAALYAVENVGVGFRLTAPFPEGELGGRQTVVPLAELMRLPATRVIVRSPEHTPEDFLELSERIGLHGVNYAVGWTAWLDLAPEGVSKASALEVVRERLGVAPNETLAVGDGRNDLEMFAWAGWAVAMGQAVPEVLAAADEIAPPVDQDGAAVVLESLLPR
jgi:hydroxymethylpyrimidine pyrophosphatase-like HAD family hydrolase